MAKQTVQGLMLVLLNEVRTDVKSLKDDVASLKIKAAIMGAVASLVTTGLVSAVAAMLK